MDIVALIIAIVAALATTAASIFAWLSWRDSTASSEKAQAAADTAATATERLAQIQSRIFDGPPWEVKWFIGDSFLLTNNSPVDAVEVHIGTNSPTVMIQVDESLVDMPIEIGAKSAIKFMFSRHLAMPGRQDIIVRWKRDGSDIESTWTHPIPYPPADGK